MLEFMNFQVDVLENLLYRGLGWEGQKGELKLKKLLLVLFFLGATECKNCVACVILTVVIKFGYMLLC